MSKTWIIIIVLVCTVALIIMSSLRIRYEVTSTLSGLGFSIVLWHMLSLNKVTCKILAFFGTLSWELYLCHTRVLFIGKDRFADYPVVWFAFTLFVSACVSLLLHGMTDMIVKRWSRYR